MNENINLCKILKDCPINTEFYSPLIGNCKLSGVDSYEVVVANPKGFLHINPDATATTHGYKTAEPMLLPSQTQPDWSKWECPKLKFDPKTLQPFDRVIVKPDNGNWHCSILSHREEHSSYYRMVNGYGYPYIVPYNEETKQLLGTSEEAPKYYRYWEK